MPSSLITPEPSLAICVWLNPTRMSSVPMSRMLLGSSAFRRQ